MNWLDQVKWDAQGLVPVIAQEAATGDVLMFAWMNREALAKTAELGRAVYYSRSRGRLWFKGDCPPLPISVIGFTLKGPKARSFAHDDAGTRHCRELRVHGGVLFE